MCCDGKLELGRDSAVSKSLEKKLRETAWVVDMLRRKNLLATNVTSPAKVEITTTLSYARSLRIVGEELAWKFLLEYVVDPELSWTHVEQDGDEFRLVCLTRRDGRYVPC